MTDSIDNLRKRAWGVKLYWNDEEHDWFTLEPHNAEWELRGIAKCELDLQAAEDIIAAEERRQVCPQCGGKGYEERSIRLTEDTGYSYPGIETITCPNCNGTGKRKEGE